MDIKSMNGREQPNFCQAGINLRTVAKENVIEYAEDLLFIFKKYDKHT